MLTSEKPALIIPEGRRKIEEINKHSIPTLLGQPSFLHKKLPSSHFISASSYYYSAGWLGHEENLVGFYFNDMHFPGKIQISFAFQIRNIRVFLNPTKSDWQIRLFKF